MTLVHLKKLALAAMLACSAVASVVAKPEHLTAVVRSPKDAVNCGIGSLTSQEMLKAGDQPLLRFVAREGAKPVATIADPREDAFYVLEFGVHNVVLDKILPAKKAVDLKNMIPLSHKGFFGFAKKMVKTFRGKRKLDAPIAAVIEDAMSAVGLLNVKDYQGTFFKDEYSNGMPMVIVVDNVKQLRCLQEYFIKNEIVARNVKPWLLLEVLKNPEAVTQADLSFWGSYFDLVKASDDGVADTLRHAWDFRNTTIGIGRNGGYIGSTLPEVALANLEKAYDDLKTADLAVMAAGALGAGLWLMTKQKALNHPAVKNFGMVEVVNPETGAKTMQVRPGITSAADTAMTVATCVAAGAIAYGVYRLWVNTVDTMAPDEELDEEAHDVNEALAA